MEAQRERERDRDRQTDRDRESMHTLHTPANMKDKLT